MSVNVFKRLNISDTFVVPYTANKSWDISSSSFADNQININIGINYSESIFNSYSDYSTNGQYDRLVYNSIRLTYYPEFLPKTTNTSSLANTIYNDGTLSTSSYWKGYTNAPSNTYTIKQFPTGSGAIVYVLNIPKNLTGDKILPGSFEVYFASGSSTGKLYDDGNYNLLYSGSAISSSIGSVISSSSHIGNIF
jgi:hypothetical protein